MLQYILLLLCSSLLAKEFTTDQFFPACPEASCPFSLDFPEEPELVKDALFLYGAKDKEGMEYGVTVRLRDSWPHASPLSWLLSLKKTGEFVATRRHKLSLAYDFLLVHHTGKAIRVRLQPSGKYLFVLMTRVENPLYFEREALSLTKPEHEEAKRDNRKSLQFFNSLKLSLYN